MPRSPAAMLRQCEMDWSCHICFFTAFHSSIAAGGVGVLRCPRKNYREKKCRITWRWGHGGHMACSLFRKRDGTYRGTKICMCFEVKVPHGACVLILDCRLSWKQWISWLVIIASVFWFQIIQSGRVLYGFESPWASLCPRAITVSLGAPRMPTNLLHHGP